MRAEADTAKERSRDYRTGLRLSTDQSGRCGWSKIRVPVFVSRRLVFGRHSGSALADGLRGTRFL